MIALSGVRSSCDMLARNSDLCLLAISSSRLLAWISLNRRAFWIAITAWSAKVLSSASSLSVNGCGGSRETWIAPTPRSSQSIGAKAIEKLPAASATRRSGAGTSAIGEHVGEVDDAALADRRSPSRCLRAGAGTRRRERALGCSIATPRKPPCAACRRRRSGRCRARSPRTAARSCRGSCRTPAAVSATELLITCSTSAVAVCCSSASFVSLKQARVLDRDHRLVGEGLEQLELACR